MNISDCGELQEFHTPNSFQYFFISDLSKIGCFVIYLRVAFKTESTILFYSTGNDVFKF